MPGTDSQSDETISPLAPGERVARFEIVRLLGTGGSADVYEAENVDLGRRVALKIVRVEDETNAEETLARFRREARTAGALAHPHIANVYDVGHTDAGDPYLVMELLDGEGLDVVAARSPMPIASALEVVRELADALVYVHAHDVVHRDVKPHNMVLRRGDSGIDGVKLLDFGISKPRSSARERTITRAGSIVGTPHYMPPEAFVAGETLPSQDVYAAGVVLYECLTGRPPYDAPSIAGVIAAVMRTEPTPVRTLRPDCPESVAALVEVALARDVADRFPSAVALRDAIDEVARSLVLPVGRDALALIDDTSRTSGVRRIADAGPETLVSPPTVEVPMPPRRRVRVAWPAAAAAAALVLVVGGGMATATGRRWLALPPDADVHALAPVVPVRVEGPRAPPRAPTPARAAEPPPGLASPPPARLPLAQRDAARALVVDALDACSRTQWAHADGLYRAALRLDPANADAWLGLGNVETRLHHTAEARRAYRRFLALAPPNDANAYIVRDILAREAR